MPHCNAVVIRAKFCSNPQPLADVPSMVRPALLIVAQVLDASPFGGVAA